MNILIIIYLLGAMGWAFAAGMNLVNEKKRLCVVDIVISILCASYVVVKFLVN